MTGEHGLGPVDLEFLPENLLVSGDVVGLASLWRNIAFQEARFNLIGCARFTTFVEQVAQRGLDDSIFAEAGGIIRSCSPQLVAGEFIPTVANLAPQTEWGRLALSRLDPSFDFRLTNPSLQRPCWRTLGKRNAAVIALVRIRDFLVSGHEDGELVHWTLEGIQTRLDKLGNGVTCLLQVDEGFVSGQ